MKVGIDISQVVYSGTGVARFTRGLTEAIIKFDTTHEWIFFFSSLRQKIPSDLKKNIEKRGFKLINLPLPPTLLSFLWNTLHIIPIEALMGKFDWFISSDWTEPPSKMKKATIVHDLVFLRYPETLDNTILETQKKRLKWVKKESHLVFADSKATQKDLLNLVKIKKAQVKVIYPGVDLGKHVVKKGKKPFILTVGKLEPRKNIKKLIDAFQRLDDKNIKLYVVGMPGWKSEDMQSPNVHFLGYVSDEQLANLYSSCLFFVYPSLWEGFGYPIIEAMNHGAPVATSNTSSLAEIAGNDAELFDPNDTESIYLALKKLVTNSALRGELSKKGLIKSKMFTWEKYLSNLIHALENSV